MACSPNNAQLLVSPLCPPHLTRSFWYLVLDGSNVEVSFNVLVTEKQEIESIYDLLKELSTKGNQTHFSNFLDLLRLKSQENEMLQEILLHVCKTLQAI